MTKNTPTSPTNDANAAVAPSRAAIVAAITARTGIGALVIEEKLTQRGAWDSAAAAIGDGRFADAIALLDDSQKAT